jgi:deoxyribodipyrimidine photolyase-related protein
MQTLRVILGDQLSPDISALSGAVPGEDVILLCETMGEATNVPHHKQKIALIFAAMRHFANRLKTIGHRVHYETLDDPDNTGSLTGEIARAVNTFNPERVIITEPGEWRQRHAIDTMAAGLPCPLTMLPDTRFLCSRAQFSAWANNRKILRMEYFYRDMRNQTGLLMTGGKPEGGEWNYDSENRKKLPRDVKPPSPQHFAPDAITTTVIDMVKAHLPDNFGDLDAFGWAVTPEDANIALDHFIRHALTHFGDYQDAMASDEPFVFHSILSPYINIGLLDPLSVCRAAEQAYRAGHAPLNAVEGFIRQIIGWREYVRGLYWHLMPDYATSNALNATRHLPSFYWTGDTPMACLAATVKQTQKYAYAHHIQRLMITGNFALLAGLAPVEVEEWYLAVFADAFDWVELPNTHGMALYADGGQMASKPYAASGAYINRMSNYCSGCAYDVKQKSGPKACPFNYLYWNFLATNAQTLAKNPRLAMPYKNLQNMTVDQRQAVASDSQTFLNSLRSWKTEV